MIPLITVSPARALRLNRVSPRRFNQCNLDLAHWHHGLERAPGCGGVGIDDGVGERAWRDLPRNKAAQRKDTSFSGLYLKPICFHAGFAICRWLRALVSLFCVALWCRSLVSQLTHAGVERSAVHQ